MGEEATQINTQIEAPDTGNADTDLTDSVDSYEDLVQEAISLNDKPEETPQEEEETSGEDKKEVEKETAAPSDSQDSEKESDKSGVNWEDRAKKAEERYENLRSLEDRRYSQLLQEVAALKAEKVQAVPQKKQIPAEIKEALNEITGDDNASEKLMSVFESLINQKEQINKQEQEQMKFRQEYAQTTKNILDTIKNDGLNQEEISASIDRIGKEYGWLYQDPQTGTILFHSPSHFKAAFEMAKQEVIGKSGLNQIEAMKKQIAEKEQEIKELREGRVPRRQIENIGRGTKGEAPVTKSIRDIEYEDLIQEAMELHQA